MISLKGFEDEEIGGKPNGSAPVGIPAKHVSGGLAGGVGEFVALAVVFEDDQRDDKGTVHL